MLGIFDSLLPGQLNRCRCPCHSSIGILHCVPCCVNGVVINSRSNDNEQRSRQQDNETDEEENHVTEEEEETESEEDEKEAHRAEEARKKRRRRRRRQKAENDTKNATADRLNDKGMRHFEQENYTKAIDYFKKAYDECTPNYGREEEFETNLKKAKKQLKTKNEEAERLYEKGKLFYQQKNFKSASKYFQRAYQTCASGYEREVKFEECWGKAEKEIKICQADKLHRNGLAAMDRNDFEEAKKLFDLAYTTCPHDDDDQQQERRHRIKANQEEAKRGLRKMKRMAEEAKKREELLKKGKQIWKKGWKMETEDEDHVEAGRLFMEALDIFKKCGKSAKDMAQVVQLKIDGNNNFNEGHQLREEADQLTAGRRRRMDRALKKYEEAKAKLEVARASFNKGMKTGDRRFAECKKIVDDYLVNLQGVMEVVQNQNLILALNSLSLARRRQHHQPSFDIRNERQSTAVVPNFIVQQAN